MNSLSSGSRLYSFPSKSTLEMSRFKERLPVATWSLSPTGLRVDQPFFQSSKLLMLISMDEVAAMLPGWLHGSLKA